MPGFNYNGVLIHEWIKATKIVLAPKLDFRRHGEHGARLRAFLQIQPAGTPAMLESLKSRT